MRRRQIDRCRFVEVSGVFWDGKTATPIIAQAPGATPNQDGVDEQVKGLVVESQAEANEIAGYVLAERNNPWPDVPLSFQGNHAYLDIAPQGWLTLSVDAQDTKRGLEWTNKKLVPRRVSMKYDSELQLVTYEPNAAAEATGDAGVGGDYTPVEPLPVPIFIGPGQIPGWNGIAWVGTDDGVYLTMYKNNYWERVTERVSPFLTGADDALEVNDVDVIHGSNPMKCIIATNQGVFVGVLSATGVVTWTKLTIDDPPDTWSDGIDALEADDLEYSHVRVDITDATGDTFCVIGTGTVDSEVRTWI